ncbi:thiol reductant ABC exporter subunit CydC [Monashia sp. NPDC004114]
MTTPFATHRAAANIDGNNQRGLRLLGVLRRSRLRTRVWWPSSGTVRGGLLGGIATAAGMALTATSGWLIVRASEQPVILTLLTAIVAVRAFGMARPVFRYWERLVSHDAALALLARRRTAAYGALIPLTPARLGRRRRSDVLTGVVDDLTDVVDAQVRVTVPVISTALAGGMVIALTAALAVPVGLVLLALGVVVVFVCGLAAHLESRSLPDMLAARAEVTRVAELMATQASELRAVGGWGTALGWLDSAHDRLARVTRRISLGRAVAAALFLVAVGAAVATCAVIAQGLAVSAPVKALLVLAPVAVSEAITPLVDAMRALARARGSERRIDALLDLPPAVQDRTVGNAGEDQLGEDRMGEDPSGEVVPVPESVEIVTRGVTASWRARGDASRSAVVAAGAAHADLAPTDLAPTDLELPPGRRLVVTGPNGSGKSTLLAVLARHLDPTGGEYLVDDTDALDEPLETSRSRIAFVDAETHVFATTLRNNLTLARPDATDADVLVALESAGLGDLVAGLPDGLDTTLGAGGRGLSGGERARLGIARAHLSGRPVVLLDEPVAHLDPPTAHAVVADLTRRTGVSEELSTPARTIVMVTHRDEGTDLFDEILELHHPASGTMPSTPVVAADHAHEADPPRR